jgi:hypothetical protein
MGTGRRAGVEPNVVHETSRLQYMCAATASMVATTRPPMPTTVKIQVSTMAPGTRFKATRATSATRPREVAERHRGGDIGRNAGIELARCVESEGHVGPDRSGVAYRGGRSRDRPVTRIGLEAVTASLLFAEPNLTRSASRRRLPSANRGWLHR